MLLEVGLGWEVYGGGGGCGERRVGAGVWARRGGRVRGAQSKADGSSMVRSVLRAAIVLLGFWFRLTVLPA